MAAEDKLVADIAALSDPLAEARGSIERRFVGQHEVVEQVLAAILSGGHALLVGQPGLGKTMLVDTLSTVLGLAIATSTSAWVNVALLGGVLIRENSWRPSPAFLSRIARVIAASVRPCRAVQAARSARSRP